MAKTMSRYQGLTRRDTYEEILSYLEQGGPNIPFPDRTASFIRASPEYQNLLTYDFIDIQKQQENMLKQQKKNIIIKEQASQSGSDMKSVLASESPQAVSAASEEVQSDLSAISAADITAEDIWGEMDEQINQMANEEMAKRGKAGMLDRLDEVNKQHQHLGGLRDKFEGSIATGTQDYSGATSSKFLEKHVAEGQRLDQVRVLPAGMKNKPQNIYELSKNPEDIAKAHEYFGLSPDPQTQGAASSSSGVRSKSGARVRSVSTKGTKNETNNPETAVAKARGRPVNPDSARQKAMAKKQERDISV